MEISQPIAGETSEAVPRARFGHPGDELGDLIQSRLVDGK